MSNVYSQGATSALNEKDYINKIYDKIGTSQKDTIQENYDASVKQLDTGKQTVQNQTADYVKRAYVEGNRAKNNYQTSPTGAVGSRGNNTQAALTIGNQNQSNVTALSQQEVAANQEFERQRKLLADKYSAAIKQAQADNDMNRAQALYDAAKAEEEQLRALRQSAASLMAGKGDNSILDAIGRGVAVTPDTTSATWEGVTKNDDSINEIYDKNMESQKIESETAYKESLSDLEAKQAEARRTTDQNLTKAYVDALKKDKNYREVQTAYGQGSGTAAQAQLARETGLTGDLTNLRKLQLKQDSDVEQQRLELLKNYGEEIAKAQAANDLKRVKALYEAAEKEEQTLVEEQKTVGNALAKQNNYSVLGKLYGLTPDQVHRLQGTGAYAPVYYGGGGGGYSGGSRGGGGGDDTGGGGGTFVGANPSIIGLGQGPISSENLQSQIASGNVTAVNNGGKVTYISTPQSPVSNNAGITVQLANAGKPHYSASSTASSNKSSGGVVSKVVNAVKSWFGK